MLLEMGHPHDVVDAVLAEKGTDPYATLQGVKELSVWVTRRLDDHPAGVQPLCAHHPQP